MIKFKQSLTQNPTKTISLSFLMVLLLGAILLSLPICNQAEHISFLNHLFVATSATCVTGLTPVAIAHQYNVLGQIVIILMIQIGGLGFLTLLLIFFQLLKKRLSFSSRLLMAEAINQNNLDKVNEYVKYIIRYTFSIEALGAVCLLPVFLKDYPFLKAIYFSIFHSISAFCNAGFDLIGSNSIISYQYNPWFLFVIASLITLGGIGFLVAKELQEKFRKKHFIQSLSLHTKIVLVMSIGLILVGALLIYCMEFNNAGTIGKMPLIHQITNSLFQSVTYRTAGFASFDQGAMHQSSKLLACFIMVIGGSPAGTAGGIKTVTVAALFLAVRATLQGKSDIVCFNRRIAQEHITRALAIICISLMVIVGSSIVLCLIEPFDMIDLLFEVFSAFATVGLTCGITASLSVVGKMMIIILMFIGRIGPVAMMLTLMRKHQQNIQNEIKYPKGDIIVG